jgi:hypothetical protein
LACRIIAVCTAGKGAGTEEVCISRAHDEHNAAQVAKKGKTPEQERVAHKAERSWHTFLEVPKK